MNRATGQSAKMSSEIPRAQADIYKLFVLSDQPFLNPNTFKLELYKTFGKPELGNVLLEIL